MIRKIFAITTYLIVFLSFFSSSAQEFDLGAGESQFKWGVEIPLPKDSKSDFSMRVGTRLQTQMENVSSEAFSNGEATSTQDFFARRVRFQLAAKFQKNLSYYMDIRADKIDKGNNGSNSFALGDAFFQIKNLFGSDSIKLRLFRSKYDISRTQTVSSSRLMILSRASISDFAADYISAARRGTNLQFLGNWSDKISTQLIIGDSVQQDSFDDALGSASASLNRQNFAFGTRVRISPFTGWEEGGLTETYFGQGKHFAIGAGYFAVNNIEFETSSKTAEVDRALTNFDLSFHYGPFSIAGEYFIFDGMIDNFGTSGFKKGRSTGWFTQGEYVLTSFHFLAPYVRYQHWNRFKDTPDLKETTLAGGLNYYIKGNKLRVGLFYEKTEYGEGFSGLGNFSKNKATIAMNLMMHY